MSKIDGDVTKTVVLGRGRYGTHLTVTDTGMIAPAAYSATGVLAPGSLASASLANAGTIAGGAAEDGTADTAGTAVVFKTVGRISNTGTIIGGAASAHHYTSTGGHGGTGIALERGGTLVNHGLVAGGLGGTGYYGGPGGAGVVLGAAAHVANDGTILGGRAGNVFAPYGASYGGGDGLTFEKGGVLVNHGTIRGGDEQGGYYRTFAGGNGVTFQGPGSVTNDGTIAGGSYVHAGIGVALDSGGTLTNTGVILGGFDGGGHNGELTGGGNGVVADNAVVVDKGMIEGGGFSINANNFSGYNGGTGVVLTGGTLHVMGTVAGGSGENATLYQGGNGGAGVVLDGGSVITSGVIAGGAAGLGYYHGIDGRAGDAVLFSGAGTVTALQGATFDGAFGGWQAGDVIDLRTVSAASLAYAAGTLTLYDAKGVTVDKLAFDGNYTDADFGLAADGHGGTDIVHPGDFGAGVVETGGAQSGSPRFAGLHDLPRDAPEMAALCPHHFGRG